MNLPVQSLGPDGPMVSRIALGCADFTGTWNPAEYGPENVKRCILAFEAALEAGITFYDHADIYGGFTSEAAFKECLTAFPGSRERIFIATKCGICSGHYNLSYDHINRSIDGSLDRMGIDYVDLYQMHRPDPLTHPAETARALNEIVRNGKARMVGVSNYYPEQVRALQHYLDIPLCSNQFRLSLGNLPPIYSDGTLDQCMAMNMTPLAYSPLFKGRLSLVKSSSKDVSEGLRTELSAQATKYNGTETQVALAWLLAHPAQIIPLVGSTSPDHIREAAGATAISLSREDWFNLWIAARGENIP